MEISALYSLVILGCLYHIVIRKVTDFLTISFFGMSIYFSPGLVGFVIDPYYPRLLPSVPIQPETYYVFIIALCTNIAFSIATDKARVSSGLEERKFFVSEM